MAQIDTVEPMVLLNLYCDSARPLPSLERAQLLVGIATPPIRSHMATRLERSAYVPGRVTMWHPQDGVGRCSHQNGAGVFRLAETVEAQAATVIRVLAARLARALGTAANDSDWARRFSDSCREL
ncbi:hypothetical protein F5Y07DRAFT_361374 [Xylaria sp. FL0933]|nr:hypothetical protein F5Y07DRAFT_361374 [Xylaria sp. FL0933]